MLVQFDLKHKKSFLFDHFHHNIKHAELHRLIPIMFHTNLTRQFKFPKLATQSQTIAIARLTCHLHSTQTNIVTCVAESAETSS